MHTDTKLQAHVAVDPALAVRGFRTALWFRAIRDTAYFYAVRLVIVWIVISIVNALLDATDLNGYHLIALILVWIAATTVSFIDWHSAIGRTDGWEFDASLDDMGVSTTSSATTFHAWDAYRSYREFDDYIEIEDQNGNFSFLPKEPEYHEIIEFTKTKIPEKPGY